MELIEKLINKPVDIDKFRVRNPLIDNFRGIAIIFYMLAQVAISYLEHLPLWVPHNAGINGMWSTNLGFLDLGPVMFYFLIGLTIVMSFNKSLIRNGKSEAYKQLFYRNLSIIGIDALGGFIISKYMYYADWGVLRSIGLVGIMMIPFINKKTYVRAISAVVILLIYQLLRVKIFYYLSGIEGGIAACFGFVTVVLLVTVLKDLYDKGLLWYSLGLIFIISGALISYLFVPIVYSEYNSTYLLSVLSLFGLLFLLLALVDKYVISKPLPVISWIGQSMIFFLIVAACSRLLIIKIFPPINLTSYINAFLLVFFVCSAIATFFRAKKIIIKI